MFLVTVGVHVLFGLTCTITGIIAMLSAKRPGRHPGSGHFLLRLIDYGQNMSREWNLIRQETRYASGLAVAGDAAGRCWRAKRTRDPEPQRHPDQSDEAEAATARRQALSGRDWQTRSSAGRCLYASSQLLRIYAATFAVPNKLTW